MRRLMVGAAALAMASLWVVGAGPARAATFVCNEIGAPNQGITADVLGNVQVPADGQCNIKGFTIGGTVQVGQRAKLFVWTGSLIKGSIVATGPKQLNVADGSELRGSLSITGPNEPTFANTYGGFACGVKIGGNVTLQNLTAGRWVIGEGASGTDTGASLEVYDFSSTTPELNCKTSNTIGGTVKFASNNGVQTIELAGNTITGSVSITNNTASNERLEVEANKIGGTLACSGNTRTDPLKTPIDNGGEHNTAKTYSGQCVGF